MNQHSNTTPSQMTLEQRLAQSLSQGPHPNYHTRQRIWNKARVATRRARIPSLMPYHRAAYPLLVILMLFGLFGGYTGVVVASGPSVPGEFLYPLERQAELIWLKLTPNARRSHVQLVLLERRVYEANALLNAGQIVPDNVLQEIELLFFAVADTIGDEAASSSEILPHLVAYQDTIQALAERYPGISGLHNVLEAANTVVITLGGDPRNHLP